MISAKNVIILGLLKTAWGIVINVMRIVKTFEMISDASAVHGTNWAMYLAKEPLGNPFANLKNPMQENIKWGR